MVLLPSNYLLPSPGFTSKMPSNLLAGRCQIKTHLYLPFRRPPVAEEASVLASTRLCFDRTVFQMGIFFAFIREFCRALCE